MGIYSKIKNNLFLRNAILAICTVIILVGLTIVVLNVATRHGQVLEVPDFSGVTYDEAIRMAGKSYKIQINDSLYLPTRTPGIVLEQSPSPGSRVKSGRKIFLTVNAFSPKIARIPYVTGYSLRQAKNNLEVAGFEIEKLVYRKDIAVNNVLEQWYQARMVTASSNIDAPTGSEVILVVGGNDSVRVRVPRVLGYTLKESRNRIQELGFNIGKITEDIDITEATLSNAHVYRQEPAMESVRELGATVNLWLTLDEEKLSKGINDGEAAAKSAAQVSVQPPQE